MSVKRNVVANYVGQASASIIALALVPVYISYLGIEAYGLVGLFAVVQAWLTLLDLGMTPALGREMARYTAGAVTVQAIRDLIRSLEIVVGVIALAVALVFTLASGWLAGSWLRVDSLAVETAAASLSLLGAVVALRFCEGIYRSAIIGLQQQVWINGATIALSLLRGGGAVAILAWVSTTIEAFFLWQGFVSLVTLGAYAAKLHLALPHAPRGPRFSLAALATVRGFAGGMFAVTMLNVVVYQVDKLLLSRLLGLTEFAHYLLAATVGGGLYLVAGPIVQAVAPEFVRLLTSGDTVHLTRRYHQAAQLVTVLAAPVAAVLMLFAPGVLIAWSGDTAIAAGAAGALALLALAIFLNILMQVPLHLQFAAGWTSLALRLNAAVVVVLVPALLWLVPRYGGVAAAGALVALNIVYLFAAMPLMHRRLLPGALLRWAGSDVVAPLLGTAAVLLPAWWLQPSMTAGRIDWLIFLMATGALALAGAALAADTVRGRMAGALRNLARRRALRPH